MSQGEEVTPEASKKITGTDFSFQFSAAREYQKVEKKIFNILSTISREERYNTYSNLFVPNQQHSLEH